MFLEKGRWRLPRWFFSCSTSIAVARPMIQTRRDLVLKHLSSQCTFQLTWNKNPKWHAYLSCILYLLIPYPNPDIKLALAESLHPLPPTTHAQFSASFKESTDLRWCLKVRDSGQENKARKSAQNVRKSTWQSHKDDFCPL